MCNATWPMISQSRGFCFAPCDQVHPSICRVSPSILMQSGTLHMHVHEILVYFNSCGGVRVGLCVSGLFVYVGLLRLKKSSLMQRLFHDLRISHNAPWAHQIPGICPITLWPWLAVRRTNESGHIVRRSLSAINDNKLHNTHLNQWYSG